MAVKYKYKSARLVHHGYSNSKRWYVIFYAWDVSRNCLRRRRIFDQVNSGSISERLIKADLVIAQINRELRAGKVLGKPELKANPHSGLIKLSLLKAVKYVQNEKQLRNHRVSYLKGFDRLTSILTRWLDYDQRNDFPVRDFRETDAHSFVDFMLTVCNLSNKSVNNYRNDLATVFNFLMKRNDHLFRSNPMRQIDKLPVVAKKHPAFSDDQMKRIYAYCRKMKLVQTELLISFIYYTLARPNELFQLRAENINLNEKQIFFSGVISKNRRDEYIGIPPGLVVIIRKHKLHKLPPKYFIFGRFHKPGPEHCAYVTVWKKHRAILKEIGILQENRRYTLYSYKHSGAISLYRATKDIKLLQRQCRHTGVEQTNNYLRDLGVFTDYEGLEQWKGAI